MNYKITNANNFKYNKAFATITENNKEKNICIDTNGKILFELPEPNLQGMQFDFGEIAKIIRKNDNKIAIINTKGKFLTDFIYTKYKLWYDNNNLDLVQVQRNGNWGYIDTKGQELIPCMYNGGISCFSDGVCVVFHDKKPALIDTKNNIIIPFGIYQGIGICFNNTIPVKKGEKWGLIDKNNNILVDFIYDDLKNSAISNCNLFAAQKSDKWGIIDRLGEIREDFIYDEIIFDSKHVPYDNSGYWKIRKDSRFALYSSIKGKFITKFTYDCIGTESYGLFEVNIDDKYGFINNKGQEIIPIIYDATGQTFSEGLTYIKSDSKYGMINNSDEIIIPIEYKSINNSSENLIVVQNSQKQYGVINHANKVVIPFGKYDIINNYSCGYALVKNNNGYCYIDKSGKFLELKV